MDYNRFYQLYRARAANENDHPPGTAPPAPRATPPVNAWEEEGGALGSDPRASIAEALARQARRALERARAVTPLPRRTD
ncbi:hypothetical protein [Sphingomicrobium aestuariivivum]|uniref:hypothetical protein n=1 Tax=Sphingomicrobium aestuariivivum TaxID=1582356 RepID=UPI001FD67228|nr:hypothetical protein [Sphingomicrobium aestuariivivum]MCJ8191070.1 hypothetical protein [Sphingomicrobium aestuariivivum]